METLTATPLHDLHDFYVARINSLVETEQEALIPALAAEYDDLRSRAVEQARRAA